MNCYEINVLITGRMMKRWWITFEIVSFKRKFNRKREVLKKKLRGKKVDIADIR